MKYYIITYGCQMNKSDSERIATVLESRGYEPASKINEADLIVVNMCSVRQSAVDREYVLGEAISGRPSLWVNSKISETKNEKRKTKNYSNRLHRKRR